MHIQNSEELRDIPENIDYYKTKTTIVKQKMISRPKLVKVVSGVERSAETHDINDAFKM